MEVAITATPVLILRLHMEEGAWDRAVEQAKGRESAGEVETLTLDGVVKCMQGKLPNSKVFAPFTELKRLSIANVGLSSLADFPSLPHLERLILSDNRIAGGLEHLVRAGLKSLRELDLSNNKIQSVEDLKPLARLKLESLDLYECPVTRSADYRAKVFGMMKSLRFLDKTDMAGTERPESDDEEEESEEEEDVDDHNSDGVELEGEEDGVEGNSKGAAVLEEDDEEVEEEDEPDDEGDDNEELEDEDEDDGGSYQEEVLAAASGRGVVQGQVNDDHGSDEEAEYEEDNVEVHDIEEASEEDIGEEDDEDAAIEEEEDEEEPASGAHVSTEGELDVQENENEEDENGELEEDEEDDDAVDDDAVDNDEGEEEVEEEDDDEEEYGTKYLVQPIGHPEEDEGASDFEPGDDEVEDEDFEDEDDGDPVKEPVGLTQSRKRIREETDENEDRSAKH